MATTPTAPPPLTMTADAQVLQHAGLRVTPARLNVLSLLSGQERLQTAQDLHDQLRRRGDRTGLTTVYRTVAALADAGVLHVFGEDGERGYRRCTTTTTHQHLICRNCGLVLERAAPAVDQWVTQTAAADSFDVQEHRTEVHGLCRLCLAPTGPRHPGRRAPAPSRQRQSPEASACAG